MPGLMVQPKGQVMSNSKRLVSILLLSILISSVLGWYAGSTIQLNDFKKELQQRWELPVQQSKNLTVFNHQLTELKIWGQQNNLIKSKLATPEWRLVGITRVKGTLKALIEMNNELSLKRVSVGEVIYGNIKILSISDESINVDIDGKETEILLYQ